MLLHVLLLLTLLLHVLLLLLLLLNVEGTSHVTNIAHLRDHKQLSEHVVGIQQEDKIVKSELPCQQSWDLDEGPRIKAYAAES